jgi:glycosyltransferase involved in cell wall biosynthesis
MPLQALARLAAVPGVRLISLQKGPSAVQADAPPSGMPLTNLGPLLSDFGDTAAVIESLDLVITVDTSVAHLAGALGRPVWIMLMSAPDWRWLRGRDDSPWYPSVRLFRQPCYGDWDSVVADVTAALTDLAAQKASTTYEPVDQVVATTPPSTIREQPETAPGLYLAMPLGRTHGWGVCGRYLAKELAGFTDVRLITDPIDDESVSDELELAFLRTIAHRGLTAPRDASVLQCMIAEFLPYRPTVRGKLNVGYTFFEDNHLTTTAIENAKRHWDIVVAGSSWCQEVLEAHGLTSVRTVIQGIDQSIFYRAPDTREYLRDRFVVFSGGKLELRKGQDLVIRAFKVLQDRHKDVVLVNSWFNMWDWSVDTMRASPLIRFAPTSADHVARVNQVLEDNGVDLGGVVTLRSRANNTMPGIYRNTDVGLFPNRCEGGTNLVLMEYMACGKPAVVSYNSGHKDVVDDNNAILIRTMKPVVIEQQNRRQTATWEEPDLDETIERLEWAYQHRDELQRIGDRAGEDLAKLTWKRTAAQFYEILSTELPPQPMPNVSVPDASVRTRAESAPDALQPDHLSIHMAELHERITNEYTVSDEQPGADIALLAKVHSCSEFGVLRDRLAVTAPVDSWQQDGLHFFVFQLMPEFNSSLEPPTAVFTMSPDIPVPLSAVVITPRTDSGEAEIKDLCNAETAYAAALPV